MVRIDKAYTFEGRTAPSACSTCSRAGGDGTPRTSPVLRRSRGHHGAAGRPGAAALRSPCGDLIASLRFT
jgi:hypothetical protein